jgi:hypothetical protein
LWREQDKKSQKTWQVTTTQDTTRRVQKLAMASHFCKQIKEIQNKTRQDNTRQDNTRQDKAQLLFCLILSAIPSPWKIVPIRARVWRVLGLERPSTEKQKATR